MHNQTGNGFVVNNGQLNESEKHLYEEQIALLKEELSYVKRLLEEVLKK